jgi:arginine-tRNA-protein transferase
MIEDTPVESGLTEFRTPDGTLAAVCLFDGLADGISAVYSFFDPELSQRSLGTLMVMWAIERARSAGLPYAYLGYWIAASQKMAYKARFQPLEALGANGWRRLETP